MSAYSDKVIADGAVAYWRLNETSGTTAVDVIGGNNGTISGGVTLNQGGATVDGDKAMAFDGTTGKINVATGAYQTFGTGPLTVECWVRLISITTGVAAFVDMKGNGSGAAGPALLADSTSFYFRMNTGATQVVANGAAAAITDGQWRHLVGVLSRGPDELRLYLNGALIGGPVTFSAGANVSSTQGTGIGTDSAGSVWFLNGAMDDVAVYPTALTAAQIQAHYAIGMGQYAHFVSQTYHTVNQSVIHYAGDQYDVTNQSLAMTLWGIGFAWPLSTGLPISLDAWTMPRRLRLEAVPPFTPVQVLAREWHDIDGVAHGPGDSYIVTDDDTYQTVTGLGWVWPA